MYFLSLSCLRIHSFYFCRQCAVWLRNTTLLYTVIQEERSIFWEVISVIVRKKNHMNMWLILNNYQDRAVWISRPNSITFLFVGLIEERRAQKKGGYTKQIARSHFGCCCPHKETWRTQTNNMRSSHTSCKVHWGWRWDFKTFIVNCNKFATSV
jgi:hypothetical protein